MVTTARCTVRLCTATFCRPVDASALGAVVRLVAVNVLAVRVGAPDNSVAAHMDGLPQFCCLYLVAVERGAERRVSLAVSEA
jgi:hypothetical protein